MDFDIAAADVPIPAHDDERRQAMQVVAQFGAPAYLRRAKRVEDAYQDLLDRLSAQRRTLLDGVRLQLRLLLDLAGTLGAVRPLVNAAAFDSIRSLARELDLHETAVMGASPRRLRRAVADLAESIARFNRRWTKALDETDLTEVNRERDGYNRWYVLEKECAVGVVRARQAFRPLPMLTRAELGTALPGLPDLGETS